MKQYSIDIIRLFVSCSTEHDDIRTHVREIVSRYNTSIDHMNLNDHNRMMFVVYTYEDLSGAQGIGGNNMQDEYEKFVSNEADVVFGFFDDFVGEGTLNECRAAKSSLRRPLVYIFKPRGAMNREEFQYQTTYRNLDNLDFIVDKQLHDVTIRINQEKLKMSQADKRKISMFDAMNEIINDVNQELHNEKN